MRILQNISKQELDRYAGQPTAKQLLNRIKRDSVAAPAGDKAAAAPAANAAPQDTVEISGAGGEAANRSAYYNYYNVKGRYSPETPQTPGWREQFAVVDDRIKSDNGNHESALYQAYCRLEDIYYDAAVGNRAQYRDVDSLKQALAEKYLFGDAFKDYDYTARQAMYDNELSMTMYGTCGNMNDPRLNGPVKAPAPAEQAAYNRKMVNTQIGNLLAQAGVDAGRADNLTFAIEPFNHTLTVAGTDAQTASLIEQLLNRDDNAAELFAHLLQSNRSRIDAAVLDKYRAIHNFKEVTGEDLRTYASSGDGLVDGNGRNALTVYTEALKTTDRVPAAFKDAAAAFFAGNLQTFRGKDFAAIPELELRVGFAHGELQDNVFNPEIMKETDAQA